MTEEFSGVVQRAGIVGQVVYTEEALAAQDGKVIPLTLEPGGPVIGEATLKYVPEDKALEADFRVDDPIVAEFLRGDPPSIFG